MISPLSEYGRYDGAELFFSFPVPHQTLVLRRGLVLREQVENRWTGGASLLVLSDVIYIFLLGALAPAMIDMPLSLRSSCVTEGLDLD